MTTHPPSRGSSSPDHTTGAGSFRDLPCRSARPRTSTRCGSERSPRHLGPSGCLAHPESPRGGLTGPRRQGCADSGREGQEEIKAPTTVLNDKRARVTPPPPISQLPHQHARVRCVTCGASGCRSGLSRCRACVPTTPRAQRNSEQNARYLDCQTCLPYIHPSRPGRAFAPNTTTGVQEGGR
jgi:hypothetical protein